MATSLKNLSSYDSDNIPSAKGFSFGIVVSAYNEQVTNALMKGAMDTLVKHGALKRDIITRFVPGSFELPLAAQFMAEYTDVDAVICLGCVIRGETSHFDYICQGVTRGITELNLHYNLPIIFGVLTTENLQQARDRAGGKHGNKGDEAAIAAIRMARLQKDMSGESG